MNTAMAIVQGTIKDDGTVELKEKISLPPGPVEVTVVPLPELPKDDPFWESMRAIWAGQKARGHVPRTKEEIDADIGALRGEWEQQQRAIERLQKQCWQEQ